ncbi:MAG: tetrahydrofolate dehydrogenase/cyclohydrolase catalytic domain-containing protein [Dehalococcoidales bacterium]|nr:tetrahydrofolate dehydrogenase/cyclohydrolase catalytic domain-containing protein [Dehalococcoidales bacterium]
MAVILDGKKTSADIKAELAQQVIALRERGITPGIAGVLVGENPGSASYVKLKEKAAEALGIKSNMLRLPVEISEAALLSEITKLNADPAIHGIFVQLPLPTHVDENRVLNAVLPRKDVDGFNPANVGKAWLGQEAFLPATPAGIDEILRRYRYSLKGKHAVIVNIDNLVGKPLASLWAQEKTGATVTLVPPDNPGLSHYTKQADIIIVAVNKPNFITAEMVKEGVIAIDFGANYIKQPGQEKEILVGDLDFPAIARKAEAITPVPGGIGPMTVTMLMSNTIKAAILAAGLR